MKVTENNENNCNLKQRFSYNVQRALLKQKFFWFRKMRNLQIWFTSKIWASKVSYMSVRSILSSKWTLPWSPEIPTFEKSCSWNSIASRECVCLLVFWETVKSSEISPEPL